MKKFFRKALATVLAGAMVIGAMTFTAAADEEEYQLFIAYGGDKDASGDWGYQYYGSDADGITATTAAIKVGETQTISLEFATPALYTWFDAPVLVAEGVSAMDVTVTLKIDGEEVDIDAAAGDAWWYEGTGDYTADQAIRLYGGYNEWGTQYVASPENVTKIEYTITLNSIEFGGAAEGELTESTEEYDVFVAIGADKDASNDWGYQYYGADAEGVTAVNGKITSGGTTTVSVEFATPALYTWFVAPVVVAEGVAEADFTVETYVDGVLVESDPTAGDNWWYEGTGDYTSEQAVRLNGGYNEWGTQYIASPENFSKIEFVITANSIMLGDKTEETAAVEIPDPTRDIITIEPGVATEISYANAPSYTPDARYTVTSDTVYVTITVDYVAEFWNAWCANGLVVTSPDGTAKYYAFGGSSATWDISISAPDAGDVVGGANNADGQWLAVEGDDETAAHAEFRVLVDGAGSTVDVYALGWDSKPGETQYTITIVDGDGSTTDTANSSEANDGSAAETTTASESTSSFFPLPGIPIIAVVVIAAVVVVVCVVNSKKKKED